MFDVEKRKYITLVLTHQCNLRCSYCYEKHKDNCRMSFETAKDILDKELNIDDGTKEVEIDLFGGEPLLEFELIKEIVNYCRSQKYSQDYIFYIITNGACLTDDMKTWFANNNDILQIGLSLDGTREMHNINRCNSFDKIDLDFFRNVFPNQPIKMTISKETLPHLAEGVIYCHELGFDIACNLAYGIDWSEHENEEILAEQLNVLIDYYIKNPNIIPCAMFDVERLINVSQAPDQNLRVCGAGWTTKAFDYDGKQYPCQHFLPLSVGEEKAKESQKIKFHTEEIPDVLMNKECSKCVLRNICMTCYGANYAATGDIFEHDKNMCKLFKIQYKALAYFAVLRFQNNQLGNFSDSKKASILQSALMIDSEIC